MPVRNFLRVRSETHMGLKISYHSLPYWIRVFSLLFVPTNDGGMEIFMDFSKLKTRTNSAVILVVLLLVVTFLPAWIFTLAACAASFMMLREITLAFKHGKKPELLIAELIFSLLFMVSAFLSRETGFYMTHIVTVLFLMTLMVLSVVRHETVKFEDVGPALIAVLYTVVFFLHLAYLRQMDGGVALVFLAYIGAFIPDTAAYFAGNFFGKHKLIPAVSPKKTVEGAVGAVVGSLLIFLVYGLILSAIGFMVNYFSLLLLSIVCGVVAQLGDLSASVIKRTYGTKDFGNLIPGHGGLLDRLDSVMFIAPIVYYFVNFFPIFI